MNRSNVGNIVTNAQQVLSVGAFTAGGYRRALAKAEQTLNNRAAASEGALSPEEEARYRAMKSGKKMEAVRRWETASDDPYRLLSDKEASDVTAKKAEKLKAIIIGLNEFNPMMGHRGCRLAVSFPEIAKMQTKAIINAAINVKKAHNDYKIVPFY